METDALGTLSIDERDNLAQLLDPVQRLADRKAIRARDEQRARNELSAALEIRDATHAAEEASKAALDEVLDSMSALINARGHYKEVMDAGKALQARARKAELPVPQLDNYANRVLTDPDVRRLNNAWRVMIVSEIR